MFGSSDLFEKEAVLMTATLTLLSKNCAVSLIQRTNVNFLFKDLMLKIDKCLRVSVSMTMKTLKNRLQDQCGDGVLLANMRKSSSVASFRGSVLKIVNQCYNERPGNEKDERMRIVRE